MKFMVMAAEENIIPPCGRTLTSTAHTFALRARTSLDCPVSEMARATIKRQVNNSYSAVVHLPPPRKLLTALHQPDVVGEGQIKIIRVRFG